MSRILSELLGANEQRLRTSVDKLERASNHPNADIRLAAEVGRASKIKMLQLGLDPHDTTGEELYAALAQRLKADDARLVTALKLAAGEDDSMASVAHSLRTLPFPRRCLAIKAPVVKAILKKIPPKKTMKQLGYRSFDSMVKHESCAALYAAASQFESAAWHKQVLEAYKKLNASDFETRDISIIYPTNKRWLPIASAIAKAKRRTVLSYKELGAVVVLPVTAEDQPPAVATTTLVLALQAINEIRSASAFLKFCQVRPNFGAIVQTVVRDDPQLSTDILDQPVPWQIIQRYYSRFKHAFNSTVFEPHLQLEDLSWHSVERLLEQIEPSLSFWRGGQHVSLLHNHQPVSCNLLDVALNYCNKLSFANRIADNAQLALWHELLLKYLKHENIERTVLSQLQSELVAEPALT